MALRKQLIQNFSSDGQPEDDEDQEDAASAHTRSTDELSSALRSTSSLRENRRAERKNHSKRKEMTEEEMMDLAVQLSKQEASNSALRKQQEDEDVMKAIQESMVNQTQPPRKPPPDAAPQSTGSRRKLLYSNGEKLPEDEDVNSEAEEPAGDAVSRRKKRKRGAGSPLLTMPDLSQTQNLCSQDRPCSPASFSAHLDSPQSSDSTHIDDSQLQMSPVFPLTGCRAEVHLNRLNVDVVETCRSSGFVLCSQDSSGLTASSPRPRSPVFPQSNRISCPTSPEVRGEDRGHEGQTFAQSPVFGRTAERETSPSPHPACEDAEFCFSSQESLTPTVRSDPPQSPVFPKSPSERRESTEGQVERRDERSVSPVFGLTDQQDQPAEHRGSDRKDRKSDGGQTAKCNRQTSKSASAEVNEKAEGRTSAETEPSSDMTLIWSEQEEDDVTPVGSPSPVFPEEKAVVPADSQPGSSLNHHQTPDFSPALQKFDPSCDKPASSGTISSSTSSSRQQLCPSGTAPQPERPSDSQTIHYYWGVPFCPRGLDPDTYTKVIVAQMEVYEKSLKRAQRGLLRKAEWGEAIQPQQSVSPEAPAESAQSCVPRRRGLRLRGTKRSEAADFLPEEERKDEEEEQQGKEEEEKKEGDAVQTDTDDCEVCPETQLSDNNSTKDLSLDADAETPKAPELPEIQMIPRGDSPTRDDPQEPDGRMTTSADLKMEENVSRCREDAGGQLAAEPESRDGPDVEETEERGPQRSGAPEVEAAVVPRSPEASVDCPICQASFPACEIEMHAAYCDGEVAEVSQRRPDGQGFQDSVKPRRKRVRRTEAESEESRNHSDVSRQEKCFICQKSVPVRDFSRHTELCVQRGTMRRTAKGNLLSALEQTESRHSGSGPSGSKVQPDAVIDLRDDDDDDEDAVSAYKISDSPIRSFTPISEATGCLIDFRKQQRSKKPAQRRR